jgi:hypothetical protein
MEKKEVMNKNESGELSYDTKTLITVITLVTVYPVGLILMFVWMKWSKWLKFFVAFPVILVLLIPLMVLTIMLVVAAKVISQPEETVKTFDMIREEVRKEVVISPTIVLSPTKVMVKQITGTVKK